MNAKGFKVDARDRTSLASVSQELTANRDYAHRVVGKPKYRKGAQKL